MKIRILLALFILTASLYSVTVPAFETPDEIWHFAFVNHLAEGNGLPVAQPDDPALYRQQGVQAPGYYLAAAALTGWIDQSDFPAIFDRANPHRAIGQPDAPINRNYLIHYPDQESFPWQGSFLALHIARLFSVLLGAVTVFATYKTLMLLTTPAWAFTATAVVAFIPQFVFISAAASNDNAINAAAALVLWQLVALAMDRPLFGKGWTDLGRSARFPWPFLALGVTLGLALIAKLSVLALVGIAGLVVLFVLFQQKSLPRQMRILGQAILWIGGPILLVAGWWYLRNFLLYGDFLAWNIWQQNILLRVVPADWLTVWPYVWAESGSLFRSFWGLFGWMNVGYPAWVYWGLGGISIFLGVGGAYCVLRSAYWLVRRRDFSNRPIRNKPYAIDPFPIPNPQFLLIPLLWLALLIFSWVSFMRIAPAAQGRYFFPALPALALLVVMGLGWAGRWGLWAGRGLAVGLFGLTLLTPVAVIQPVYRPAPMPIASPEVTPPVLATFGAQQPQIALLSAQVSEIDLRPGQTVTVDLTWQSLAPMTRDWSIFIHLVDETGLTVAQLDTMPGGGLRPTSRWPVDGVLAERYRVTVPQTVYAPNQGSWRVGFYDYATGERLSLTDRSGADSSGADSSGTESTGDSYTIAPATIAPRSADGIPNPVDVAFADGVTLLGYSFSDRVIQPGQEMAVTLYWTARGPIGNQYTTFAHILDETFTMHGGQDKTPQIPTTAWTPGDVLEEVYTFVVSGDAPPGIYQFEVGLYTQPDFRRLRLIDVQGAEGADRLILGPVRVEQ